MALFSTGYEDLVRLKLGVSKDACPDSVVGAEIHLKIVTDKIASKIPDYATVIDTTKLAYLENAAICYLAYLLLPSVYAARNIEVQTLDVKWKKESLDLEMYASLLLGEFESSLQGSGLLTVEGVTVTMISLATNTRYPIGSTTS